MPLFLHFLDLVVQRRFISCLLLLDDSAVSCSVCVSVLALVVSIWKLVEWVK